MGTETGQTLPDHHICPLREAVVHLPLQTSPILLVAERVVASVGLLILIVMAMSARGSMVERVPR